MVLTVFIVCWLVLVLVGTPIGVSMIVSSLGYFLYNGVGLNFAAQRIVDGLNSFPIIAVPLFILAANLFNASGITHHIFGFANSLVGHIRGGMGHVNILADGYLRGGVWRVNWRPLLGWHCARVAMHPGNDGDALYRGYS